MSASSSRSRHAIGLYLDGIRDGRPALAAESHVGDRYTQHSTGVRDGRCGFIEFVSDFVARHPRREINIVRVIEDGPYVFLHVHQRLDDGEVQWVTTDFFELDDDDRVIEHWDVITAYAATTPSGHTSIDGPTVVVDRHRTETNKTIVREMITQTLMPGGDPSRIAEWIDDVYIQHNAEVADGLAPFAELASAPDRPLDYHEIVLVVGEGNFVATLCRASWAGTPVAQVDLFRLEHAKIVEHWDASEPVPTDPVNSGKF